MYVRDVAKLSPHSCARPSCDCEAVLLLSPPFEARSELLVSPKRHGQLSVFLGVKQLSLDRRLTFFDRTSVPLSDPA